MMPSTTATPLVRVESLAVHFDRGRGKAPLRAVDGVSFDLLPGETLGVIGESGSGKSTLARAVVLLQRPSQGRVWLVGQDAATLTPEALRLARRQVQIVFQDPRAALNPRMRVAKLIGEPLLIQGIGNASSRRDAVMDLLERVELGADFAERYPHQLSGGQRQRVNIARALAVRPRVLVCDEVVAALDLSIQAGILNLFKDLQEQFGLTTLFITHDLGVTAYVSSRVAVMYLGVFVEMGSRDQVIDAPLHPYTRALLDAAPEPVPAAQRRLHAPLQGEIPSPVSPPSGCRFRTRCPIAVERCAAEVPAWRELRPGQHVACHRAHEALDDAPQPVADAEPVAQPLQKALS
jgi:oligopeptide/dipeptide ABC transporter ATP-binding protein